MPLSASYLDRMTDAVIAVMNHDPAVVPAPVRDRVRAALAGCWADSMAVIWTTEDIQGEFPGLTRAQARDVLDIMDNDHDASIGISWDTMTAFVYRAVPDYDPGVEYETIRAAVAAYAERLVAAGDKATLIAVFGDPDNPMSEVDEDDIRDIYRNHVLTDDEDDEEDPSVDLAIRLDTLGWVAFLVYGDINQAIQFRAANGDDLDYAARAAEVGDHGISIGTIDGHAVPILVVKGGGGVAWYDRTAEEWFAYEP